MEILAIFGKYLLRTFKRVIWTEVRSHSELGHREIFDITNFLDIAKLYQIHVI